MRLQARPPNEHGKHLTKAWHTIRAQARMTRRLHAPAAHQPRSCFICDPSRCCSERCELRTVDGYGERSGEVRIEALCHGLCKWVGIGIVVVFRGRCRTQLDMQYRRCTAQNCLLQRLQKRLVCRRCYERFVRGECIPFFFYPRGNELASCSGEREESRLSKPRTNNQLHHILPFYLPAPEYRLHT